MSAYLQLEGIKGESQDEGHKDWINLESAQHAIERPVSEGASGSTRHRSTAKFLDINCTKEVDASTPKLAEAIADGTRFQKVRIHFCTSSEGGKRVPFLMWELTDARVTRYAISAAGTGEQPSAMETLAFNYEEIKQTYDKLGKDNKSQGKVEYTWKLEEGVR